MRNVCMCTAGDRRARPHALPGLGIKLMPMCNVCMCTPGHRRAWPHAVPGLGHPGLHGGPA